MESLRNFIDPHALQWEHSHERNSKWFPTSAEKAEREAMVERRLALVLGLGGLVFLVVFFVVFKVYRRLALRYRSYNQQAMLGRLPESMREGSALTTIPLTEFQYVVGIYAVRADNAGEASAFGTHTTRGLKFDNPTEKVFLGTGTLMKGWLVTAAHVVETAAGRQLFARTFDNIYHPLGAFHQIYTDLVLTEAPAGYKSAKIETLSLSTHARIVAARDSNNSSLGILRHDTKTAFGFCSYDGSTLQGFSGAPYTNGTRVLAIHLGGGSSGNFGYSASFVVAQINLYKRPESSELSGLENALKSAGRSEVEYERGIDETRVRVGGAYFVVDNSEFDDWADTNEFGDWFFDDSEDGVQVFRPSRRQPREYEEPDYTYEPEGVSDPFLGGPSPKGEETPLEVKTVKSDLSLQMDSQLEALQALIALQQEAMKSTQDMQTASAQAIAGLTDRLNKLEAAFVPMRGIEDKLMKGLSAQLTQSLTTLEQRLTGPTESPTEDLPSQEKKTSTGGSSTSSQPSIQKAPLASGSSGSTPQSVMRWATMDSDLKILQEWRNSVDVASPSYPHWREEFMNSKGWTVEQKKALVNRLKNLKTALTHKRQKNRQRVAGTQ